MHLKRLFNDKKTKLVYSNGPSLLHFSYLFNDSSNRTTYKTYLKSSIETHKKRRLAQESDVANVAERQ